MAEFAILARWPMGTLHPWNALKAMIEAHARHVCTGTDRARTAVYLHERKRQQRRKYLGDEHAYRKLFEKAIGEGRGQGLIRPEIAPKLLAICLLGALNSTYQWYRPNGESSMAKISDHFVKGWLEEIAGAAARPAACRLRGDISSGLDQRPCRVPSSAICGRIARSINSAAKLRMAIAKKPSV